jgi:hypothetical protein
MSKKTPALPVPTPSNPVRLHHNLAAPKPGKRK